MSAAPSITNTSLGGHLRLECSVREDGVSFISRQDFRVPIHIGKGHTDEGMLLLNIANPTAGFFDGDRVDIDVTLHPGARLCLSTPAASRVYPTRSGLPAANHQHFSVGENALLEWNPEPFIPHAGASYHQTTSIDLHPDASLFFLEWIAPGRVAMGECFAYQRLRWELDLVSGADLLARERDHLRPGDHSLEALRAKFPQAHYLSLYAAGAMTRHWPAAALDAWDSPHAYLGHGPLQGGVHVIRAICEDSVSARALAGFLRNTLYQAAGLRPPSLGRVPA